VFTVCCVPDCLVPAVCLQLVAPPGQHVSGTVELLTLSPCRQLTCLEVLTSSRLYVPFTLKTVSLATLAWPKLAALRLSLAGAVRLPVRRGVSSCLRFAVRQCTLAHTQRAGWTQPTVWPVFLLPRHPRHSMLC
jgi:hypothetical protein